MLAVGRAMMSMPKLLLLDEPSMGLAPNLVDLIFELILKINKRGTTVLLIEQNANMALQIADRGYVLETGRVTMTRTKRKNCRQMMMCARHIWVLWDKGGGRYE